VADGTKVDWPTCEEADCVGVRLATGPRCLAHCNDEDFAAALKAIGETGEIDTRGVPFGPALLEQVLNVASRDDDGNPEIKTARFDNAVFSGGSFRGIQFSGEATFRGAVFNRDVDFWDATFGGDAWFGGATFSGVAGFGGTTFRGDAWFGGATFRDVAAFWDVTFSGVAGFGDVTFSGDAWFGGASFSGDTWFRGVTFSGVAGFHGVIFRKHVTFSGAKFEQASSLGPVLASRHLALDDVEFTRRARIEVSSAVLSARRARFPAGVQFQLRWAHVILDEADFPAPSTLSGSARLSNERLSMQEKRLVATWRRYARLTMRRKQGNEAFVDVHRRLLSGEISERPQILSVRNANVAGLAWNGVALSDCRYAGAHNLDKLRLADDISLTTAPAWIRRFNWDRRQVIAEECAWRVRRLRRWTAPWWPDWVEDRPEELEPGQIAGLYRALRKGREDNKDEPGAADYYYGEMEMRRHTRRGAGSSGNGLSRGLAEHVLLTAYWLVSGYGLRAWRALAWLAVTLVIFAVLFHFFGFRPSGQPDSYWQSLLYTFRTTLSLPDREFRLTAWGKLFQAMLRITGPVLLGLAALAFRGRVKR